MIKKLSTLLLLVLVPSLLLAQSKNVEFLQKTRNVTGEEVISKVVKTDSYSTLDKLMWVDGTVIGFTYYDYMTNGALGQKIKKFDDNTLMVITMAAEDQTAGTSTRGSYYNYFNGTTWLDTAVVWNRIETARKGWGNVATFNDKTAVTVSHAGFIMNINSGTPEAPAWVESTVPSTSALTWPKHATSEAGSNFNIYVTGGITGGSPVPFVFSHDGGSTWTAKSLADTLSPLYPDYRGNEADDYMVDASGTKVAVVNSKTSADVVVYISNNEGATFTSTLIYDLAKIDTALDLVPFDSSFFPASDYKMLGSAYPDGTCDLMIDAAGVVHVAFGTRELGYYINTDTLHQPIRGPQGQLERTFFITDYAPNTGIYYWNSNMTGGAIQAVKPTASMVDPSVWYLLRGSTGFYPTTWTAGLDMSCIGMPNMSYDADGKLYMVFSGLKANDRALLDPNDPTSWSPFAHAYLIASGNMGAAWTAPKDIYGDALMSEDVNFPGLSNVAGDKLHVLIQNDQSPGTWLQQPTHPQNKNAFIYIAVDKPVVDVKENVVVTDYNLAQNYPNPFNPSTLINYSIPSRSNVTLKIYDMLGREVRTLVNATQEAGSYDVSFNASGLASGLYVYTLEAGSFKISKKMMLMK